MRSFLRCTGPWLPRGPGCPDKAACLAALATAGPVRPAAPVVTGATGAERASWRRGWARAG
jgi:hypothetical protein